MSGRVALRGTMSLTVFATASSMMILVLDGGCEAILCWGRPDSFWRVR